MNLTVEQLMTHAIHFLRTGQPRMAELYMDKALFLLAKARKEAAAKKIIDAITAIFKKIKAAIVQAWDNIRAAVEPAIKAIVNFSQAMQADFTLEA